MKRSLPSASRALCSHALGMHLERISLRNTLSCFLHDGWASKRQDPGIARDISQRLEQEHALMSARHIT